MTAVFYHSSYRTRCFYRPFVINVIVFWNRGPQSGSVKQTHTHTHTRAHINTHPHPLWRRFNERILICQSVKTLHNCPIFAFPESMNLANVFFSKLFCIIDVNAQFLLTETKSVMSFPQKRRKILQFNSNIFVHSRHLISNVILVRLIELVL